MVAARPHAVESAPLAQTETAVGGRVTLTHLALFAAGLLAVFVFAQAIETSLRLHTNLPYYDQWAAVIDYGRLRSGDYGLSDWFSQHNEHRPAVPRLFVFGDYYLFGGQNYLLSATNIGLQLVEAALLAGAAFFVFRGRRLGAVALSLCAAVALALQFTTAQIETFVLPWQIHWTIGYTAGTGAMAALIAAHARSTRRSRIALLALSILLAAVSHYSVANGLWVWLLLLVLGVWRNVPKPWLLAIAVAGAASTAFYFAGYSRPADSENPLESLAQPLDLLDYGLVIVGGPVLPVLERWGARIVGGLGVLAAGAIIYDALRRRRLYSGAAAFLVAQMVFSSLTIALIALGRTPLGGETAEAPRYVMPAASLWTCIAILSWHLAPRLPRPVLGQRFAAGLAALLLITAAASPWRAVEPWENVFDNLSETRDALRTGVYDDGAIVRIYPDPAAIKPHLPILERYDISLFRNDRLARLIGEPLEEHFGIAPGLCIGFFDATIDAHSPAGAAVAGWAWDSQRRQPFTTVLIAGPDGVIRGVATTQVDRLDVLGNVGGVTSLHTGWFGYSRPTGGPAQAFVVVARGAVCPLSGEHEVVASPG